MHSLSQHLEHQDEHNTSDDIILLDTLNSTVPSSPLPPSLEKESKDKQKSVYEISSDASTDSVETDSSVTLQEVPNKPELPANKKQKGSSKQKSKSSSIVDTVKAHSTKRNRQEKEQKKKSGLRSSSGDQKNDNARKPSKKRAKKSLF